MSDSKWREHSYLPGMRHQMALRAPGRRYDLEIHDLGWIDDDFDQMIEAISRVVEQKS